MIKKEYCLLALYFLLNNATASVATNALPDAVGFSSIALGDSQNLYLQNYGFGQTSIFNETGGKVRTIIGADGNGTPFVEMGAVTSYTKEYYPSVSTASLSYNWKITGESNTPVLVHITTSGWISGQYGFTPDKWDTYNLYPNYMNIAVSAYFGTYVAGPSGYDQRTYGLQTGGNFNWGVTRVNPTENFTQQNGGNSVVDAKFTKTFDLWALPNLTNYITLQAAEFLYSYNYFNQQYAHEFYSLGGYIDPVITIDEAYAEKYTLQTSYIPSAVPEPTNIAMVLAGLLLIGLVSRRRILFSRMP